MNEVTTFFDSNASIFVGGGITLTVGLFIASIAWLFRSVHNQKAQGETNQAFVHSLQTQLTDLKDQFKHYKTEDTHITNKRFEGHDKRLLSLEENQRCNRSHDRI